MLTWLLSLILSFFATQPTTPTPTHKPDNSIFQTEIQGVSTTGKPGEKTIIIDDYIIN